MPFAICGFILGIEQSPDESIWQKLLWISLAMIGARSAAMGFNRLVDRKIDAANPRTQNREIPSGKISPLGASIFVIIMSLLFVMSAWQLNTLCLILSPLALIIIFGYSYTKRFTSLSHLFLGISLSLAPLGAYIAVTGTIRFLPILLAIAVAFWSAGFDIIYSLQDQQFDRKKRLHSIPARFGYKTSLRIAAMMHLWSCAALFILMNLLNNHNWMLIGTIMFLVLLIYQHILINRYGLKRIDLAFFTLNGAASILYCLFFVFDYFYFA